MARPPPPAAANSSNHVEQCLVGAPAISFVKRTSNDFLPAFASDGEENRGRETRHMHRVSSGALKKENTKTARKVQAYPWQEWVKCSIASFKVKGRKSEEGGWGSPLDQLHAPWAPPLPRMRDGVSPFRDEAYRSREERSRISLFSLAYSWCTLACVLSSDGSQDRVGQHCASE